MENKITDKGWAAMRTLLDREMPVKRRRRFAWWWFALLLLPIAVFGSWNWWNEPKSPQQKQENHPVQAYATHQNPDAANPSGNTLKEPEASKTEAIGIISPAKNPQESAKPPFHKPSNQSNYPSNNPSINPSAHKTSSIAVKNNAASYPMPPEGPLAPIVQAPVNVTPLEPADLPVASTQPVQEMLPSSSLPTPLLPLTIASANPATPAMQPVTPREDIKHWAFGANTVLSTEQFNTVNGFSTGLTVDWKFAKKFGLRTGLLYSIYEPQEQHRPVASVTSVDYTSKVDGNIIILDLQTGAELTSLTPHNSYGDSLSNNVFIPVNRLERLELPVTLFWQAAKPLKIFGGVNIKRTLSTKADRQNYSGDYILRLSDQVAEDGASRLSSSEFGHWSADATLGAGLQIGKIFELGIAAKMPLNKLNVSKQRASSSVIGYFDSVIPATQKQNSLIFSLYGTMFF